MTCVQAWIDVGPCGHQNRVRSPYCAAPAFLWVRVRPMAGESPTSAWSLLATLIAIVRNRPAKCVPRIFDLEPDGLGDGYTYLLVPQVACQYHLRRKANCETTAY
jgi:hypothetical protein